MTILIRPSLRMISQLCLTIILCCLVTACEQNNQTKTTITAPPIIKKYPKLTTLKGIISDKNQAIFSGIVKVTTPTGKLITSTTLENTNHYQLEIPTGTELPLILTFHPQMTDNGKEMLTTAAIHPNLTQYDLNPFTTMIAKKALALGGYTHTNMLIAAENAVHVPDENKTSSGWRGDPTKQYGGWH